MKLNFSISELIYSDAAIKNNILNQPDNNSLDNLLNLIYFCLQPIRDKIAKPINITSGYRCYRLNNLLNGALNSYHLKGMAADFYIQGISSKETVNLIKKCNVDFTELIEEHTKTTSWVHIAYDKNNLEKKVLLYNNGKYVKL